MYRSLRNIVLITAVLIIGCAEPPNDGLTGPLAGIKLKDLRPADAYETPEEIHFRIFTFELPAKNFGLLEGTFESLWNSPLRFINYKAFSANGFSAGLGRDRMWDTVADKLRKAGAKKTKISALIIFDNTGNDFVAAGLSEEKTVFYTDTDNAIIGTNLSNGEFVFRIKAGAEAGLKDSAEVELLTIFAPITRSNIERIIAEQRSKEVIFNSTAFKARMSEGDFILLGPCSYDEDEMTLSSFFFTTHGDFIIAGQAQNEAGKDAKGTPSELHRNIPLIRLYLMVCTRVRN